MIGDVTRITDHRPWPLPSGPWVMAQTWCDLLFAHWPIETARMRELIPPQLEIDTFDDMAWIGVVPFRMRDVRPRLTPATPGLSAFPELNVRTYVTSRDVATPKPGVYFFSLDAANSIAVAVARRWFKLPYFRAQMTLTEEADTITYRSRRTHVGASEAEFIGSYAPAGEVYRAQPGSLEHWLTERYCLYTVDADQRVWRGDIHHQPWPLQPASVAIQTNSMALAAGVMLPEQAPILHFARHLDVVVWPLQRVT